MKAQGQLCENGQMVGLPVSDIGIKAQKCQPSLMYVSNA